MDPRLKAFLTGALIAFLLMLERNQTLKSKIQSSAVSIAVSVNSIHEAPPYESSALDEIKDHLHDIFDTIGATYPNNNNNVRAVTRKSSATDKRPMKNGAAKAPITIPDDLQKQADKELSALTDDELITLYRARVLSNDAIPQDIAKKIPAFMQVVEMER